MAKTNETVTKMCMYIVVFTLLLDVVVYVDVDVIVVVVVDVYVMLLKSDVFVLHQCK